MFRRVQPLARITPKSTIRSIALINIVLAMPTPPTRSANPTVRSKNRSSLPMMLPT